ncbi:POC1 centriolar protein A, partial [Nowakowskiella sp. JEL0078]
MIITSRPEHDIMKAFNDHTPTILKPTDEQNICDLKIYSKNFFQLHKSTSECIELGPDILVEKSEGLFIWLVLACNYLYQQLGSQITLQQVKDLPSGGVGGMDKIYETTFQRIFSTIEAKILPIAIQVLEMIVTSRQRLSSDAISNLLQLNINDVNISIRLMQSVLNVDIHDSCIQVFHKSVVDYLIDPKRCDPNFKFFVNTAKSNLMIVTKCLECLNKEIKFNICNLNPGILHKEISNFEHRVSNIQKHLVYAAKFWISHALQCHSNWNLTSTFSIGEILNSFTTTHLLHWVELLSVCDSLQIIQTQLPELISLITKQNEISVPSETPSNDFRQVNTQLITPISMQTVTLLKEINQLTGEFFKPISQSALHVYCSALLLCPEDTGLFKNYFNFKSMRLPKVITGKDQTWSPCLATFEGHTSYVNGVAWMLIDKGISLIASASSDYSIRLWDAFTGIEIYQFLGHSNSVNSIAFSKDGTKLKPGHSGPVLSVAFSPDGKVASGSYDETVRLWDVNSGISNVLKGHNSSVLSVSFSKDGSMLASGSADKTIRLWNGHNGSVYCVTFSLDDGIIASGSGDKTIRLWDIKSGVLKVLEGHQYQVNSISFSLDGKKIASGSADKTIRLWNVQSDESKVLGEHSREVTSVTFSPDGGTVASGSTDMTIRLWNIES